MQSAEAFRLVLVTTGSEKNGLEIARTVVRERLAACVNLIPQIRSVYRWKGEIADDREWLLIIKTRASHLDELEKRVRAVHTYEVPEILSVPLEQGSAPYLKWLMNETKE